MGANQSSDAGNSSGPGNANRAGSLGATKKCCYEVLGIERQATEDE